MEMEENKQGHSSVGMNELFTAGMTPFLTRTIHPVGQGAFYSEQLELHKDDAFRVVYDCGTKSSQKYLDREINDAFPLELGNDKNVIDILFVSHLDNDHISGISTLKERCTVKHVVMPLLESDLDKKTEFLYWLGKASNVPHDKNTRQMYYSLILEPEVYWKKDVKIIYVRPYDENDKNPEEASVNPVDIDNLPQDGRIVTVDSFQCIFKRMQLLSAEFIRWKYIPFNFDEKKRKKSFMAMVAKCPQLNPLPENLMDLFDDEPKIKALKRIYNRLEKKINGNSLMVYSGPEPTTVQCEGMLFQGNVQKSADERKKGAGCLYLGDVDLKNQNVVQLIKKMMPKEILELDMIQIPHHGSMDSYHPDIQHEMKHVQYYFLSYGKTYKKFASLPLEARFKCLLCVSEDRKTECKMIYWQSCKK